MQLSWKHVSDGSSRQIRLEHGGGTRDVTLNLSDKKCHIVQIAKEEFFKKGTSCLGETNEFEFDIWDSTLTPMLEEETVKDVLDRLHVSMPRFHFISKRRIIRLVFIGIQ